MNVYEEAIKMWGINAQVDMAIEEMSELAKALIKYRRSATEQRIADIVEEIVDVEIMLEQLKIIYCDEYNYNLKKKEKLDRLVKRLDL